MKNKALSLELNILLQLVLVREEWVKVRIALNLAIALSKLGLKTGILDGDVYGPSLPRLTGTLHLKPELSKDNKILPLRRYGVSLMSMGNLVEEESPLVWRGPMLFKTIEQFFRDIHWGDLDLLVIDLPPGTGDVALTIAQKVPVSGGIVCKYTSKSFLSGYT